MKNLFKVGLIILITNSCSISNIKFNAIKPAEINVPSHIESVIIAKTGKIKPTPNVSKINKSKVKKNNKLIPLASLNLISVNIFLIVGINFSTCQYFVKIAGTIKLIIIPKYMSLSFFKRSLMVYRF